MAQAVGRQSITLGVRHNKSEKAVVKFTIFTDERLGKLFSAYRHYRNDTDPRTVYLWSGPSGAQLKEKHTPQELGLHNEDVLDVVVFIQNEGTPPASPPQGRKVVVCFAGGLSLHASVPRLRAILTRLGGEIVEPPNEARMTHYVTENLRTFRALAALLTGVWVVRPAWLLDCDAGSRFITEAKHALAERQQVPPYAGKRFFLSPAFKASMAAHPSLKLFIRLLLLGNAKLAPSEKDADHVVVPEAPRDVRNRVVLTWWEILCLCPALLGHTLSRQSAEALLAALQEGGAADAGPVEVAPPPSASPEPVPIPADSGDALAAAPALPHASGPETLCNVPDSTQTSALTHADSAVAAPQILHSLTVTSPTPSRRTLSSDHALHSAPKSPAAPASAEPIASLTSQRRTRSSDAARASLSPAAGLPAVAQFNLSADAEIQELDSLIENLVSSSAELEAHLAVAPATCPQSSVWMIPGLGKTRTWLRQVAAGDAAQGKQAARGGRGRKSRGKG